MADLRRGTITDTSNIVRCDYSAVPLCYGKFALSQPLHHNDIEFTMNSPLFLLQYSFTSTCHKALLC